MKHALMTRLLSDHAQLRRYAADIRAALADPAASTRAGELEELRWSISRDLMQHLAFDEKHVLAVLDAVGGPREQAVAGEFREELARIADRFRSHMTQWTGSKVAADPKRYRRSLDELIALLEQRLDREERELYPLIAKHGSTSIAAPTHNWAGEAWAYRRAITA